MEETKSYNYVFFVHIISSQCGIFGKKMELGFESWFHLTSY